ncbi:MAG: hypothetical protein LUB59_03585 [Candidatus Gastranaerophilales bacterium]|nr:hypothetical protein [Candidatus Gastranaerophilales bacterium]
MSIRTYLKAAAIALPLAFGGGKAAAQSQNIVKAAERIVAADTLKAMDNKAADAKTLLLKRYKGQYKGTVVNGKVGSGNLNYKEAGETVPVASIVNNNSKVTVDGGVYSAKDMPSAVYKISGTFTKGNNEVAASSAYSHKTGNTHFIEDVSYARKFPLTRDLAATGRVGAVGEVAKVNGDKMGQANPYIKAGLQYNHKFMGGAKVGAKAEVGGAAIIKHNDNTTKVKSGKAIFNAEAEAGYKNVSAFVSGGRDAVMGNNVGGGVRFTF